MSTCLFEINVTFYSLKFHNSTFLEGKKTHLEKESSTKIKSTILSLFSEIWSLMSHDMMLSRYCLFLRKWGLHTNTQPFSIVSIKYIVLRESNWSSYLYQWAALNNQGANILLLSDWNSLFHDPRETYATIHSNLYPQTKLLRVCDSTVPWNTAWF